MTGRNAGATRVQWWTDGRKPVSSRAAGMAAVWKRVDMVPSKARRRANGDGTLFYEHARARWRGAVAWTDSAGILRRRSFSGRTKADVRRRMQAVTADLMV